MERALRRIIRAAVSTIIDGDPGAIEMEVPRDEVHGDLATPVAMGLAKQLKRPPRKIAQEIVAAIADHSPFDMVDIAGPGFINFTFTRAFLCNELRTLLTEQSCYLIEDIGRGRKVQVEFVSANPTGPLHLGHGRGAAVGASLSNLLEAAGFRVEREYYVNDAGRQVRLLGLSVFALYKAIFGVNESFPAEGYRGAYIEDLAKELQQTYGDSLLNKPFDDVSETVIDFSYKRMLRGIRMDLEDFGVSFDRWQSERELYLRGEVTSALNILRHRGYLFIEEGATWFRSTAFGDDKDRVVIKKDGEYTYFASDIAYHADKVNRGFDEFINIWGADHHGYIPRVTSVIEALGSSRESLSVLLVQMVSLLKGGKPYQMSKRAGEFITLREVMDEIGPDTTKFLFLTRRSDSHLEIDVEVAKDQSQENPVYYVQYVHARINSIFEKLRREAPRVDAGYEDFDEALLNGDEMRLLKKVLLYPMAFRSAALTREPHRLTFYLQEIAGLFHPYYHRYRVLTDDAALTKTRLALCAAVNTVVHHGLTMLGVAAPTHMGRDRQNDGNERW